MRVACLVSVLLVSGLGAVAAQDGTAECRTAAEPGDVLIVRFAPALEPGSADLIDVLVNSEISDLCGVTLSDGEGSLRFAHLPVAQGDVVRLTSANDLVVPADARIRHHLVWEGSSVITADGRFALAKGGDSIRLQAGAVVLDAVAYGDSDETADGWDGEPVEAASVDRRIFHRGIDEEGPSDTDAAADWTFPRIYRQHQVDRSSGWFDVAGEVRAFVCPDRCYEEVRLRIDGASRTIDLNLYDLSMREAVEPLAAAAERGVTVRVLLHDRPVGADDRTMDRIAWAVDTLTAAGAEVRTLHEKRFAVNHAKYLIVDETWSVVLSENANRRGWAPDGHDGNRGWGIAVQDEALATWMTDLFVADFAHPVDAYTIQGADLHDDAHPPVWGPVPVPVAGRSPTLVVTGDARVRPVVAPDHLGDMWSSPLAVALRDAEHEVWLQQLNLPLRWSRAGYSEPSPLVGPLFMHQADEVQVRGTLAAAFQDGDVMTPGNDQTAAHLSGFPHAEVLLGDAPGGGLVHNKGWLVDPVRGGRNLAVVGSANGNLASQALNREVTLFVEHPDVAQYYRAVLAADFARAQDEGTVGTGGQASLELPSAGWSASALATLLALVVRLRTIDMGSLLGPARRR